MVAELVKTQVQQEVIKQRPGLVDLSLHIHSQPEMGFEERQASVWLARYLEGQGFRVERPFCGLETAFRASYGKGQPAIALLAEYDALPQIGHACGHNIIAAAAVGAGAAARVAVDRYGGSVMVVGTPAEEGLGGKAIMVERGGFRDVDAALMIHPATRDVVDVPWLAMVGLDVEYIGRAAHAASAPERGINALEALILAFNGINSLRQHIKSSARIHGIITDGGQAANIVPAHSAASFLVRADDDDYLEELQERVLDCFVGAAAATGATLKHQWGVKYMAMRNNPTLVELFTRNLEAVGRTPGSLGPGRHFASTDMGNVSHVMPAIQPLIAIASTEAVLHSPEFAQAAASEAGHRGLVDGATALALTVSDLLADPGLVARAREEFQTRES